MKRVLIILLIIAIITMMLAIVGETADSEPTLIDRVTGMELVLVKGGCFKMGDTFGDGYDSEKPIHEVCVSDFYIGKYELTQRQWQKVTGINPSKFSSCGEDCPVEQVTWDDIQKFISTLNSQSGKKYRLPTEAEWEYAARSGGKKEKWAGTSKESLLGDYAWYSGNSGSKTHPVGQKKPNSLGIYDMTGNVWEWCSDWYSEEYYGKSLRDNPNGPTSYSRRHKRGGNKSSNTSVVRASARGRNVPGRHDSLVPRRVERGGSWSSNATGARVSARGRDVPGVRYEGLGFRLVAPRVQ